MDGGEDTRSDGMTMKDKDYVFGPLPKKKRAVFHHPLGFELYDGLAMDLHAMTFAEQCVKAEREACAKVCDDMAGSDYLPHQLAADIRWRGET